MENLIELKKPTAILDTASCQSKYLKLLSRFFSYLAFEAPVARVIGELSFCFILFEFLAQFSPANTQAENPGQWIALWFGCCLFVALLDASIFIPSFRIFNLAFHYATSERAELALSTFDQLNPVLNRFIHLPKKVFHLERTKLLADLDKLDLAQAELIKIPSHLEREINELAAEIVSLKHGFDALKNLTLNEFTVAASLFERALSENKFGVERNYLREAKEKFSKIKLSGVDKELAELYCHAADLFLGHAETAMPKLLESLYPAAKTVTIQNHLGKLYLVRALYGATHREKQLAVSDYKLGMLLTRPYQVKQLKQKVRLELGEV